MVGLRGGTEGENVDRARGKNARCRENETNVSHDNVSMTGRKIMMRKE